MEPDIRTRPDIGMAKPDTADGSLDLAAFLPYRLSVLANTVSRSIAGLYAGRFGLTIPEWRVLAVLAAWAPQPANGVAARTAMDKVGVSRAVARLLDRGLVARRTDPVDRRRRLLSLSPAGENLYHRIVPLAQGVEARLTAGMDADDRATLDRMLTRLQSVASGLASDGQPGPPP